MAASVLNNAAAEVYGRSASKVNDVLGYLYVLRMYDAAINDLSKP
jgi:hypothetical protein